MNWLDAIRDIIKENNYIRGVSDGLFQFGLGGGFPSATDAHDNNWYMFESESSMGTIFSFTYGFYNHKKYIDGKSFGFVTPMPCGDMPTIINMTLDILDQYLNHIIALDAYWPNRNSKILPHAIHFQNIDFGKYESCYSVFPERKTINHYLPDDRYDLFSTKFYKDDLELISALASQ